MGARGGRAEKRIGSSLLAHPTVYIKRPDLIEALDGIDLAEAAITSDLTVVERVPPAGAFTIEEVAGVGVEVGLARGETCQRCWRVLPDVGEQDLASDLCGRCADAVRHSGVPAG